ncbi:hypothetical protein KIPB_002580 [Kipferlia bialata]|uniref:Uncharacterized protein n=1 Tax=Kipferlia bialata TaxID=797122 RepID=A0A391NUH4_9EUKA|nr:hypothetical protein KIPB_002580 [Kipferlia bialata]|eukprot:g2580.t1
MGVPLCDVYNLDLDRCPEYRRLKGNLESTGSLSETEMYFVHIPKRPSRECYSQENVVCGYLTIDREEIGDRVTFSAHQELYPCPGRYLDQCTYIEMCSVTRIDIALFIADGMDTLIVFHPDSRKWENASRQRNNPHHQVWPHSVPDYEDVYEVFEHDGCLVIVGGLTPDRHHLQTHAYDPTERVWTLVGIVPIQFGDGITLTERDVFYDYTVPLVDLPRLSLADDESDGETDGWGPLPGFGWGYPEGFRRVRRYRFSLENGWVDTGPAPKIDCETVFDNTQSEPCLCERYLVQVDRYCAGDAGCYYGIRARDTVTGSSSEL